MLRFTGFLGVLVLVAGFVVKSDAQQLTGTKRFHLTWSRLQNDDSYRTVFNLLASNNGKNINSEFLDVSFDYDVRLRKTNDGLVHLIYGFRNKRVLGDIYFRNFKIDSLLLPDSAVMEVSFVDSWKKSAHYRIPVSLRGGSAGLGKQVSGSAKPVANISKLLFTADNEKAFVRRANLINHYYGYSLLHDRILSYYQKINLKSRYLPSEIFSALFALQRLHDFTSAHHFAEVLHLNRRDPEMLKDKTAEAARLLKRETTLFEKMINEQPQPGDCNAFISLFTGLSAKALAESGSLQPYRAESFKEFAAVNRSEKTVTRLNEIRNYYESRGNCSLFMQHLFDAYVKLAEKSLKKRSYVEGMIFMDNATYLLRNFPEIIRTAAFLNTDSKLHDGLMDSFLSVAVSAFKTGNRKMFTEYYGKALDILTGYIKDTSVIRTRFVFPQFRNHLLLLARGSFSRPDEGLNYMRYALLANAGKHTLETDSLFAALYRKKAGQLLERSKQLLVRSRPLEAANVIDTAYEYIQSGKKYFPDAYSLLYGAAYPVYLEILQRGQIAFDRGSSGALPLLVKAKDMEDRYFDFHSADLKQAIRQSFVPLAEKKLKRAEFEIWADHTQKASQLIEEVKALQHRYEQTENAEIGAMVKALEVKLAEKKCRKRQKEMDNLVSVVKSQINVHHTEQASAAYEKLLKMADVDDGCSLDKSQVDRLVHTYAGLFDFYKKQKALNRIIFKEGFVKALPDYAALDKIYYQQNISRFGLSYTPLYLFVKGQHSKELAKDALSYFLNEKNGIESFRYLELLHDFGVPAGEVLTYQKKLAKLFKTGDLTPPQRISEDKWYTAFSLFYYGKPAGNIPVFR